MPRQERADVHATLTGLTACVEGQTKDLRELKARASKRERELAELRKRVEGLAARVDRLARLVTKKKGT